jgi:hypothetical protein
VGKVKEQKQKEKFVQVVEQVHYLTCARSCPVAFAFIFLFIFQINHGQELVMKGERVSHSHDNGNGGFVCMPKMGPFAGERLSLEYLRRIAKEVSIALLIPRFFCWRGKFADGYISCDN